MMHRLTTCLALTLSLYGCGQKVFTGGQRSAASKKAIVQDSGDGAVTTLPGDPGAPAPNDILTSPDEQPEVVINLEPIEGAAMQVKNVNLLRSSISDCLDLEASNRAVFAINFDMKLGQDPAPGEKGKVQFYTGTCPIGADISGCLKGDLYDPDAVAGDTVSSNALSVNYLQALGTVANVVAHNCDTDGKCKCDDDKVAEGLVARCFPYLTDAAFDTAHDYLVQTCKAPAGSALGDIAKARRRGIANIIGSVGFAKARE